MRPAEHPAEKARPGRPRSSSLSRAEQLRAAKRAQRKRDAKAGRVEARLKLPREVAERFAFAAKQPGFTLALVNMLETQAIETEHFPQLKLLCWNRRGRYLSAEDAWSLYERNWRFVEPDLLEPAERQLIETLRSRFGAAARHG